MLVAGYMVMGAFVFTSLEADSLQEQALEAEAVRKKFIKDLWNVHHEYERLISKNLDEARIDPRC